MSLVIPFPTFDPVAISVGPLAIRWYALAYIAGILLGWIYARWIARQVSLWGARPRPSLRDLDDLVTWVTIGIVVGGRLGFVLVYNPMYYSSHPMEALMLWQGGMAFHGGLLGVIVAVILFSRARGVSAVAVFDILAAVVPFGLLFGRIANFINGELWGRPADVPWAMVFPGAGPEPRHPSQLYQAGLEGIGLLVLVGVAVRLGALRRPGLALGLFGAGYGLARIIGEQFRMPDAQLGFLFGPVTMGMLLSLPMVIVGGLVIVIALRRPAYGAEAPAPAAPEAPH
ncbi:prolipoprotein diacylglyceryl transferase [Acuticoccus mangrovi]|uniref:Phosphatidylglycerol--prolipoprotein diacylglyceryl transferase n=1 Tax=Acuticoccus mangrovi TaxID=2796142 RepID=A0A934INJ0_9HYPH|nr:prolipoprotein diacylglyceryl transferase [Acuticoccus mangrovi]MBJ3775155.1 prolipoprotein diacylglyceryl transferase [Acuticoccus mangrovi]